MCISDTMYVQRMNSRATGERRHFFCSFFVPTRGGQLQKLAREQTSFTVQGLWDPLLNSLAPGSKG